MSTENFFKNINVVIELIDKQEKCEVIIKMENFYTAALYLLNY